MFKAKYNAACQERESIREQNHQMQAETCELKETLERNVASNKIEVMYCVYFYVYVELFIHLLLCGLFVFVAPNVGFTSKPFLY